MIFLLSNNKGGDRKSTPPGFSYFKEELLFFAYCYNSLTIEVSAVLANRAAKHLLMTLRALYKTRYRKLPQASVT
jgi:hypothetical protein